MKVLGANAVDLMLPEHELPQVPGPDPAWQESMAMLWYDRKLGVGGILRIGHEPNYTNEPGYSGYTHGSAMVWNAIFTEHGWYYFNQGFTPLRPADRMKNGFHAGDTLTYLYEGTPTWRARDENVELDLTFHDTHQPIGNDPHAEGEENAWWTPDKGQVGVAKPSAHFEAGGRVKGRVRIRDRVYDVDCFGYRDRSWGNRHWDTVLSHRWIAGTLDENFCFCAMSVYAANGSHSVKGHIVRDNTVIFAEKTEIVVHQLHDSISHKGADVRLWLPKGEIVDIVVKPICKAVMPRFHELVIPLTGPCTFELNGRQGFCALETTINVFGGRRFPEKGILNAITKNGLNEWPDWKPVG